MMKYQRLLLVLGSCAISASCYAFPSQLRHVGKRYGIRNAVNGITSTSLQAAAALPAGDYSELASPVPYGPHLMIKGKVLNAWGIVYALITFSVAVFVLPFMIITSFFADITGNGPVSRQLLNNRASSQFQRGLQQFVAGVTAAASFTMW
jgi:hypothetical protein